MAHAFTVGVFAVVQDEYQRVLVVKHNYCARRWSLPGGGLDHDETVVDGVRREVLEESGVVILDPRLVGVFTRLGSNDLVFLFEADAENGVINISCPDEIEDGGFLDPRSINDLDMYLTQRTLLEFVLGNGSDPLCYRALSDGLFV